MHFHRFHAGHDWLMGKLLLAEKRHDRVGDFWLHDRFQPDTGGAGKGVLKQFVFALAAAIHLGVALGAQPGKLLDQHLFEPVVGHDRYAADRVQAAHTHLAGNGGTGRRPLSPLPYNNGRSDCQIVAKMKGTTSSTAKA
jgi:hypothetical protein